MSLLDGDTQVVVFPEVVSDDGYGTKIRVPAATGVKVRGMMQPVTSDEAFALGQGVSTLYRLIARSVPGGAWARVDWDDRQWDVLGEPTRRRYSRATTYVSVLLKARTPKVVS